MQLMAVESRQTRTMTFYLLPRVEKTRTLGSLSLSLSRVVKTQPYTDYKGVKKNLHAQSADVQRRREGEHKETEDSRLDPYGLHNALSKEYKSERT